jgi:hypothetical protein
MWSNITREKCLILPGLLALGFSPVSHKNIYELFKIIISKYIFAFPCLIGILKVCFHQQNKGC